MMAYSNIKSSGVSWFATMPAHWESMKIGSLFSQRKVKVSDRDYAPLSVTKNGIVPQLANAAKSNDRDNRKLVCAGDFVINSRSDRKGSCGVSELDGSVSLINTVLEPRQEWNNKYVHYLLRSQPFSEEFYRYGRGIVADLWTTRFSEMKEIILPVPPRAEQDQIVQFLDWKVSGINRLINIKKRQIQCLEEEKLSVITECVTKGMNTGVSLKDSKNIWMQQIPCDWRIVTVGRVYKLILGKMLSPQRKNEDEIFAPYFCAKDIHFDGADKNSLKNMWFQPFELMQYQVRDGDLLIIEGGAGAGGAAIVHILPNEQIMIQNSVHMVRANKDYAINEYLYFWMYSLVKRGYMSYCTNVATIPHFTKEKLAGTHMPLPSVAEQERICTELRVYCEKNDTMRGNILQQVELLQEYKNRLISDVVTGQIDVRDIAIPEYEYVEEISDADSDGDDESEDVTDEEV